MSAATLYNWSVLDRDLLIEFALLAGDNIVGKNLRPVEITNKIREIFKFFNVPLNLKTSYHHNTDKNWVWVGGEYDSIKDHCGQRSITVDLQYHPENKILKLTHNRFRRMCKTIADTILHEIIHMRQYRRRNFKDIPGYHSTALSIKQRTQQIYLGHNDEIDAYAFNVACFLNDSFKKSSDVTTYLNKTNHRDKRRSDTVYKTYLATFDFDHNHRVIKKLKKRIMYYLPYAKLGKPYKTTDWLK